MTNLVAILITTNIVRVACTCGFCNANTGVVVPEHVNSIGHDLQVVVSTNYLPVVELKGNKWQTPTTGK